MLELLCNFGGPVGLEPAHFSATEQTRHRKALEEVFEPHFSRISGRVGHELDVELLAYMMREGKSVALRLPADLEEARQVLEAIQAEIEREPPHSWQQKPDGLPPILIWDPRSSQPPLLCAGLTDFDQYLERLESR